MRVDGRQVLESGLMTRFAICKSNNGNAGAAHSAIQPQHIEWPDQDSLGVGRQRRVHTVFLTGCVVSGRANGEWTVADRVR